MKQRIRNEFKIEIVYVQETDYAEEITDNALKALEESLKGAFTAMFIDETNEAFKDDEKSKLEWIKSNIEVSVDKIK